METVDNSNNSKEQIITAITEQVLKFLTVEDAISSLEQKVGAILNVIGDLKTELVKNTSETNSAGMNSMYNALSGVETTLKAIVTASEKKCLDAVRHMGGELRTEISDVQAQIPNPEVVANLEKKVKELPLLTFTDIERSLPRYGTAIRDGLELLSGNERLDKKAIKGLDEEFKRIEDKIPALIGGGGGGRGVMFYDLSSQTTGSLKIFTVPKGKNAIILGSDFPTVLMEGNGFTLNGTRTQATLTTTNAPSSGSQLLFQYTPLFNT